MNRSSATASISTFDWDSDGDLDLLHTSSGSINGNTFFRWYENTDGAGTYSSLKRSEIEIKSETRASTIDVDGDGDQDVIAIDGSSIGW